MALVSQDEGFVLGGPVWECWAASWASAWAVLYCSRNWEPVVPVLPPLGSPTSPKPLLSMLTCNVGRLKSNEIIMQILVLNWYEPASIKAHNLKSSRVLPCCAGCKGYWRMFGRGAPLAWSCWTPVTGTRRGAGWPPWGDFLSLRRRTGESSPAAPQGQSYSKVEM